MVVDTKGEWAATICNCQQCSGYPQTVDEKIVCISEGYYDVIDVIIELREYIQACNSKQNEHSVTTLRLKKPFLTTITSLSLKVHPS